MRPSILSALVLFAACHGKDPAATDTEPTIPWLEDGRPPVAAPSIPWLDAGAPARPSFACAAGWRAVTGPDGETVCDPFPESGHEVCAADDELHLPGEPGCRPVGSACPSDGWPASLPTTGVVYVRAGEAGIGTLASPFGTISEGIIAAADGDTIAVAAGSYSEAVEIDRTVRLVGACAADTRLGRSGSAEDEAVIEVRAEGVEIADLAVVDSLVEGIRVVSGSLTVDGVAIARVLGFGIFADNDTSLTASDVVVSDVIAAADWYAPGVGVLALGPSPLDVRRSEVRDTASGGLFLGGDGDIVEDVVVDGAAGNAFDLFAESTKLARVVALRVTRTALFARGGGVLDAEDVWIQGAPPVDSYVYNGMIVVLCIDDAQDFGVTLRRGYIDGGGYAGISALAYGDFECAATLDATDLVLRGTTRDAAGAGGMGVLVQRGGDVTLTNALIADTASDGAWSEQGSLSITNGAILRSGYNGVSGSTEAIVELTDVVVADTPPEAIDVPVIGVVAQGGATVRAERVVVERSSGYGIVALNSAEFGTARVTLVDVIVRDTTGDSAGEGGAGIVAYGPQGAGSTVEADRLLVERATNSAVLAQGDLAEMILRDVSIREVVSKADGLYGGGVEVHGATFTGERVDIETVQGSGIALFDHDDISSTATLSDVRVSGVIPMTCAGDGGCPGLDAATGLYLEAGTLEVTRALVEGAQGAGLQVLDGDLAVTDGVIRSCAVGSNVQGGSAQITRVDLTGNDAEESTDALPVPIP